jgi:hypothetical protein
MAPSRNAAPPQRWDGLVSASIESFRDEMPAASGDTAVAAIEGSDVDDLISKAAVAVEGHAASAQSSRLRMARLSADAAASLRSALVGEAPIEEGSGPRGVTSGTRLDVQR